MIILIDYDNLPRSAQNDGLALICEKILRKIKPQNFAGKQNVKLRLYGGWFRKKALTRKANLLTEQISASFPFTLSIANNIDYVVHAELATTLVSDVYNEFTHTFRLRSPPKDMNIRRFPLKKCAEPQNCSISVLNSLINRDTCPNANCNISPRMAFYKAEQKMVDSMLVVDSIHQMVPLILVSGDDDMWPGIRYALMQNAQIIHIIPNVHRRQKHMHRNLYTQNYMLIRL